MNSEKERAILKEAIARLRLSMEEDEENRKAALEDLEFAYVEGAQWPADTRADRDGRPCLEINKMPVFVDQVVGDQRQNRPAIKVIPVDSKADIHIAEIYGGWIKHVQETSKSDIAVDHGFEHAVACGYGALRVVTEYVSDDGFEQDARIKKISNALSVWWGPHEEYDCSDADYCFVVSDISREEYKTLYSREPMPFNYADARYVEGWTTKDTVRVAEYFVKEYETVTLYLLDDGRVVDQKNDYDTVVNKRVARRYSVKWYLLSGDAVLEENTWVGKKYIPIIPIWGKEINIGGKRKVRGLLHYAKDSQRMYNYWQSCDTELVALAPKFPYMITPIQIAGHETQWKSADKKPYPYLLANPDPKAPGWPKRELPPQASSAMTQKIAQADQEIRDTVGLQKASLGMQSNERSGAAIRERKMEGDVGTFSFIDNLARSIEHLGRVLVDAAPGILDSERIIRLGLEDSLQKFEGVNVKTESGEILNDLSIGTYDIVVTVGPSYSTQRTEARQSMSEFIQYYPQAAPVIGDLYAKSMDWPGADKVAKRLAFLVPPEIMEKEAAELGGQETPPPETPPPPPPPPPDPVMMVKLEQEQMKLEEMKVQLQQEQIKLQQEQAKLQTMQMDMELKVTSSKEGVKKLLDEIVREGIGE